MPKFFCVSDVHGFYDKLRKALDEAGFDPENKEHFLISCGDEWDRNKQPKEVMKFFNSLERKILIKGNHIQLFEDLCRRGYPEYYDRSNGTLGTVEILGDYKLDNEFDLCCERAYNKTRQYRKNLVNYFETKRFIFVHSWIPMICEEPLPAYYTRNRVYAFNPDWRNASQKEWDDVMWENPYKLAEQGLNQTGKVIVYGHWHCSAGWAKTEGRSEFGVDAKFDPYYGDGFISIDACTAHSGKCNVIVIEDEFLEDNNG
jgi:hypothetical protein